jgi:hypothetical protein
MEALTKQLVKEFVTLPKERFESALKQIAARFVESMPAECWASLAKQLATVVAGENVEDASYKLRGR